MANELTRKGIAFGAAVALGSTLVVGGAATAAPNVNYQDLELTVADGGDSNGVFATTSDDDFGLVLSWNGDVNTQNLDDLTYDISWADADDADGEGYGWSGTTYAYYDDYDDRVEVDYQSDGCYTTYQWDAAHAGGSLTDTNSEDSSYTGFVGAWDATSAYGYDNDGYMDDWGAPFIDFGTCYTPDEKTVATVQAFIDTNRDGDIDSTESHSAAVEVTFYNPAALTPVLELDNDGVVWSTDGEDSIGYSVTFAEALNDVWTGDYEGYNNWGEDWYDNNSVWGEEDFIVESYVDGVAYDEDYVYPYYSEDVLYDSDSIDYDVTDGVEDNGSSITKVRAGLYNNATGEWNYSDWQQVVVKEPTIEYVEGTLTEQDYVIADDSWSTSDDIASEADWGTIRDDVDNLEYTLTFFDGDDEPVANQDVTVYLGDYSEYYEEDYYNTDADGNAEIYNDDYGVTVNGVEYSADDNDFVVEGTTNADGELVLDIAVENPDDDLFLSVEWAYTQDNWAEIGADLNWDATYYYVEFDGQIGDEDTVTAEVGGSYDFTAFVADQWYQAPEGDVRLQWISEDRDGWDYKYFDVASDGSAEIKLNDGAAADGEETDQNYYINEIQVKDGSAYEAWEFGWSGDDNLYIDWLTDDAVVDYVTADFTEEDGLAGISNGEFVEANLFFERNYDYDHYDADSDYEWIEGYVHAENGYNIGGAEVTISGAGLIFDDYSYGNTVAVDSITTKADEDGYYGLYVAGHKVGTHTVTVTSGGKSTTAELVLDDRNLYASAVAVSPFTGKAGTSENITATVTDKFGNLVPEADVTFSVTGGGYFVDDVDTTGGDASDNAVEDLADADYGKASEMLVILSNEVGYGSTVTATIDVVDPYGDAEDTTASASLAAGATDFGKPAFWTKDLGDGTLKLYAKNIVGAGKIQFFHNGKEIAWINAVDALDPKLRAANGSYYLVRTVKLVSGKNVLEIKDDGQRVVRRVASK